MMTSAIEGYCQEGHDHTGHDHSGHSHVHDHKNEIGLANAPVYFLKEKKLSYGLHVHYVRSVGSSGFGLGLGYERIFDDHEHSTVGLLVSYRATDRVVLSLSPGVTFEKEGNSEMDFAAHLEGSYEFILGNIHLGSISRDRL